MAFLVDSVPFTRGEIDGSKSLGGSESACLGLARGLVARGHDVHIFASQLAEDCCGVDHAGVVWHPADDLPDLNRYLDWDVFTVLRQYPFYGRGHINARLRLLWNQDLLMQPKHLMAVSWAVDTFVYVSDYQRRQYEDRLPELAGLAYVTKNGYDPTLVPKDATKDPYRIIHVSRPERGLRPLLAMWPAFKARVPQATLQICRYNSMYDAQGWAKVCESFDRAVQAVNQKVGGITYLGELGKPALYQAIADAAVMWYPGVHDFAETSCIAAIESQACGTPFVGSYKGALPETVPGGILLKGNADTPEYQQDSIDAVAELLADGAKHGFRYRQIQQAGRRHVQGYTYAAIAAEWDAWLHETFETRYRAHQARVLRRLLHEDDHTAAQIVADAILDANRTSTVEEEGAETFTVETDEVREARAARDLCDRVIAGKEQGPENYAKFALEPLTELEQQRKGGRFTRVLPLYKACTRVLDVACGTGAFALMLAQDSPDVFVLGIDYSAENVDRATAAAAALGLSDRVQFICGPVWDFDTQQPAPFLAEQLEGVERFDGIFVGEFIEHVAACDQLVDFLETFAAPGAKVAYTCPRGPFFELLQRGTPLQRGHVHHFCYDDLAAVFGDKAGFSIIYLIVGTTNRGSDVGHWVVQYTVEPGRPAHPRNYAHRIVTCRPHVRLTAGLIAKDAETDVARCLESLWGSVDEIVIGDTGSTDDTKAVAEKYGARVIDLPSVQDHPEGFAGVRNDVLAAAMGDWFLWVDTDEVIVGAHALGKYLESGPYRGYALRQNHLMLDAPAHYDTPVRVFKKAGTPIRFFGCVHEQPGDGDANTDITPALELHDVAVAHFGYLVEAIRKDKMLNRNLPLLKRDQQVFPTRRLGRVLVLRDLVNLADYAAEAAGYKYPRQSIEYFQRAIALHESTFADPADKFHHLARPWYERALQALGLGTEMEVAIAGKRGGMNGGRARPDRVWIRQPQDLERIVAYKVGEITKQMEPPAIKVDPFEPIEDPAPAEAATV